MKLPNFLRGAGKLQKNAATITARVGSHEAEDSRNEEVSHATTIGTHKVFQRCKVELKDSEPSMHQAV